MTVATWVAWIVLALLAWLLLVALPLGVLVGRAIARAERRQARALRVVRDHERAS